MSVQEMNLGFDPDELREKYRVERDKRLRPDANEQYQEMTGDFTHYVDDPYLGEKIEREPLTDEMDVIVQDCTRVFKTNAQANNTQAIDCFAVPYNYEITL